MQIRWDAVVDQSLSRVDHAPSPTKRMEDRTAGGVRVQVRLFGALASIGGRRSFEFVMAEPVVLRDVLLELTRELGDAFRARVLDAGGTKHRCCRLFVDGVAFEDLDAPLTAGADAAQVEMLLLTGLEGG
jgi:hypothetical protein